MTSEDIDENLYSRQIYTLGLEAMKRMSHASVLISGMGGLGIEIAKNVVLMGVRKVTIHDTKAAEIGDLASQFYLTEENIGQNRAEASLSKLAELNHHVSVSASKEELTENYLKNFNTVVLTDFLPLSELIRISDICHSNHISFISTQVSGLFGYVFDDFGKDFNVSDTRGEIPSRFLIEYISHDEKGVVTVAEGERHNLTDGDSVRFEEVEGMTELNGKEFEVKVINAKKFSIGDTSKFHEYELKGSGGYGNQIIPPVKINFDSLRESLFEHKLRIIDVDFNNFGRDRFNFVGFITSARYRDEYKEDKEIDVTKFVELAKKVNEEYKISDEFDENLMKIFAKENGIVVNPMCAVFGGIVGQEILKSISGKYLPFEQAFTLCYIDSTTDDYSYELKGDRYDNYRKLFGNELQDKMMNLRYFMIGAGAIGCEMIKNWAMMGLFTGEKGKLTVTDMDSIEMSNLSRQFLFRESDIGKLKSETAKNAVLKMNKNMNIEDQSFKLAEETRDIYSDEFYNSIDGVCNALDNITARLFSDEMCVYYNKPLLESGTLGPKANYQVVVPGLSESYGSSTDPEETSIPQCTIHNFPSNIDHCCEWARDVFGGFFEQPPVSVNKFIDDPKGFINEMKTQGPKPLFNALTQISQFIDKKPNNYQDCINFARMLFDSNFTWRIEDLLTLYPPGKMTEEGLPFWSGTKREPVIIRFDPENELHLSFLDSAAKILARIYSIKPEGDLHELARNSDPGERKQTDNSELDITFTDPKLQALEEKCLSYKDLTKLNTETFEKDDDSNSHIDFITAASNLRATNYRIQTQSRLEIKRLAGKIIPAIATTTAMICGFVCLEMYKIHSIKPRKLEEFRNGFVNLAISMYSFQEPLPAPVTKLSNGLQYSMWDKYIIKGDLIVQEFIDQIKEKYGLIVKGFIYGSKQIYSIIFNKKKKAERLPSKITAVIKEITGKDIPPQVHWLKLDCLCYIDKTMINDPPTFILSYKE